MLAVALAAGLLIAVNFFVLSMGELWGGGSETRLFDRHVRGVTRFLESLVQQSVVPVESAPTKESSGQPAAQIPQTRLAPAGGPTRGAGVSWLDASVFRDGALRPIARRAVAGARIGFQLVSMVTRSRFGSVQVPRLDGAGPKPQPVRSTGTNRSGDAGAADASASAAAADPTGERFRIGTPAGYDGAPPMLMFEVDEAPGQCVWPVRPLPQVECALQINADEGLVLLWKSRLEEDYGKGRPRKTQLSPFGQAIAFEYYDTDRKDWTRTEQPQSDGSGGWLVPQRLRLTFTYRGLTREVSISLPGAPGGAPLR